MKYKKLTNYCFPLIFIGCVFNKHFNLILLREMLIVSTNYKNSMIYIVCIIGFILVLTLISKIFKSKALKKIVDQ